MIESMMGRRTLISVLLAAVASVGLVVVYWGTGASQPNGDPAQIVIGSVTPPEGTVLHAGETVHFEVSAIVGVTFDTVYLSAFPGVQTAGSPQAVDFMLPRDFPLGPLEVVFVPVVSGETRLGTQVKYTVLLEPGVELEALSVDKVVQIPYPGEFSNLSVKALFTDGHMRDVAADADVVVDVGQQRVVSVKRGRRNQLQIQADDYGATEVAVSYGGKGARIRVEVGLSRLGGDLDGDGAVGKADEEIIRRAFGKPANLEDPRDLNGDGVIDKLDLEVLKSLSCGTRPNPSLIPGGKPDTGCFLEYSLAGEPLAKPPKCIPLAKQSCVDGAPCDMDGEADGMCTFSMRLTLNTSDERLPECTPTQINAYTLVKPSESDAATLPEDDANRMGILNALAGLGVLPIVGAVYTEEFTLGVPLKRGKSGLKKGKKAFKLTAEGENGAKDTNKLKLTCLPVSAQTVLATPGETATPTPTPTATPGPPAAWTIKAPVPVAVFEAPSAVGSDGAIYVFGRDGGCSEEVNRYNPSADSWSQGADGPANSCPLGGRAAAVGNRIFVVGKDPFSNSATPLEIYDITQNSWDVGPDWPTPRIRPAAVAVGGNVYVIGGWDQQGNSSTQVDVFQTSNSSWGSVLPLNIKRGDAAATTVGSTIYVFGGLDGQMFLNSVEAYDTANPGLGWVQRASMPTARLGAIAGVINGRIYVVGGRNASGVDLKTVERYDPASNSWSTAVPC